MKKTITVRIEEDFLEKLDSAIVENNELVPYDCTRSYIQDRSSFIVEAILASYRDLLDK